MVAPAAFLRSLWEPSANSVSGFSDRNNDNGNGDESYARKMLCFWIRAKNFGDKARPVIPASLIGQGILVFVAPVARRCNIGTSEKDIIPFCAGTLVLAAILLGILLLTAPGVKLTVPL